MLTYVWACLSVAIKDALGTLLVVAESKGYENLAGVLAGGSVLALVLVSAIGAGAVIKDGWNVTTVGLLLAMMATSTVGTRFWTKVGRRLGGHSRGDLLRRVKDLEAIRPVQEGPSERYGHR